MATSQEDIYSDSSDSNQMKIVEPSNEVDPSPQPQPPPPLPPTNITTAASLTSTDLPSHSSSPQTPSSPSSSQILNVSTPEDSTINSLTTTTTDHQPQQQQELTVPESILVIQSEETSVTNIGINNSSIIPESITKIDDQPTKPMTDNSVVVAKEIEMKVDTENGLISNHDNSTESEMIAPIVQPKSQGKKRSIDEVTRDPHEKTSESEHKRLVTNQSSKNEKKNHHQKDDYCWLCHKEKSNISCKSCPRTYHLKCLPTENSGLNDSSESNKNGANNTNWICIECSAIMKTDATSKSPVLSQLSPHELSELLMFAVQTIKAVS